MKSRANTRGTNATDAKVLAALFMGVIAGALAAMLTRRPLPSMECPTCVACVQQQPLSGVNVGVGAATTASSLGGGGGGAMDCTQCPGPTTQASSSSSSSSSSASAASLPGVQQWWTPATAPAATGAEEGDPTLRALLQRVAINNEVLVAVSNKALINPEGNYGMLRTWLDGVQKAGVKNYLVVAIDETIAATLEKIGVPYWYRAPKALADNSEDNHGISAQKFHMLREFLVLGYSVLLSDVDIVTLQNPFQHLHRDVDVEGLSDGFDERTAYGWNDGVDDPSMGWSRYAQTMRVFVMNSGLFYTQASPRSVSLMDKITARLEKAKEWDQAVYNEVMWFPSHGDEPGHQNPHVTRRVMDIYQFMNSKTLFKFVRHDARRMSALKPVMVHVNYHPDKWERMLAIIERFGDKKNMKALDNFPDGSCANAPNC